MSFRKRNIGLGRAENPEAVGSSTIASREHGTSIAQDTPSAHPALPGTRPSPVDGRLTTSTGTPTLDTLLAGHAGLALGHSIILEENGTTDYTGSLLKYYAAEGVVQGHTVHIVGIGEGWARGLPGLVGPADHGVESVTSSRGNGAEKMKIAWRYEKLGRIAEAAGQRGGLCLCFKSDSANNRFNTPQCMLTHCLHSAVKSRCIYSRYLTCTADTFLPHLRSCKAPDHSCERKYLLCTSLDFTARQSICLYPSAYFLTATRFTTNHNTPGSHTVTSVSCNLPTSSCAASTSHPILSLSPQPSAAIPFAAHSHGQHPTRALPSRYRTASLARTSRRRCNRVHTIPTRL